MHCCPESFSTQSFQNKINKFEKNFLDAFPDADVNIRSENKVGYVDATDPQLKCIAQDDMYLYKADICISKYSQTLNDSNYNLYLLKLATKLLCKIKLYDPLCRHHVNSRRLKNSNIDWLVIDYEIAVICHSKKCQETTLKDTSSLQNTVNDLIKKLQNDLADVVDLQVIELKFVGNTLISYKNI